VLLSRLTGQSEFVSWWVICIATLAATAPLWAGPLLEIGHVNQSAINLTVAISPISYLATLAEWDYLRGDWFYRHCPLGGLRYDYPSTVFVSFLLLGVGLTSRFVRQKISAETKRAFPKPSKSGDF
jgi:hypothetical protein